MVTSKPRLCIYLPHQLHARLKLEVSRPGASYSEVISQALELWFSEDRIHAQNNPLLRRLDRMTRADEVHTRKLAVMSDALGLFVQYFLTLIPEIPEERRESASDLGVVRFNRFIENLSEVRADSRRGVLARAEDVLADVSAFFTKEQLASLHSPAVGNASQSPSFGGGEDG